MAHIDYEPPRHRPKRPLPPWLGITLSFAFLLGMIGFIAISNLPSGANKETANRVIAMMNLKTIAAALQSYAQRFEGQLPDSFATLVLHTDLEPTHFVTPDDLARIAPSKAMLADDTTGQFTSYLYLGTGLTLADLDESVVLMTERQRPDFFRAAMFGNWEIDTVYASNRSTSAWWQAIQPQIDAGIRPVRFQPNVPPTTRKTR